MFQRPKTDPERPHWFSNPKNGVNACCLAWENLVLWHPRDFGPRLLSASGLAPTDSPVVDACWGYEFQDEPTSKIADIVLHARTEAGSEIIVAIEAKFGRNDKLKEKSDQPDTDPRTYSELPSFHDIARRHTIYLVHDRYAATVRSKVDPSGIPYGLLTWGALLELQIEFSRALPSGARPLVAGVLARIGELLGAPVSADLDSGLEGREVAHALATNPAWAGPLNNWIIGAGAS